MRPPALTYLLLVAAPLPACARCGSEQASPSVKPALRLWHTFNAEETKVLNAAITTAPYPTTATVVPFGGAQNAYRRATTQCGPDAPDVLRVELHWIAELSQNNSITPLTQTTLLDHVLPFAREAVQYNGQVWAVPASHDGLALLYNKKLVKTPPTTLDELLSTAKRVTNRKAGRFGFYVRGDGYWFLPFLWAHGGFTINAAADIGINRSEAVAALTFYRDLIAKHGVAPRRTQVSNDFGDQAEMFGRGAVAMVINGPWALTDTLRRPAFRAASSLGIAPLPHRRTGIAVTPRSGHAWAVTRCSRQREKAWALVRFLTRRKTQRAFARQAFVLPARQDVKLESPHLRSFAAAIANGHKRPQRPYSARLFDDLNPAVQAVLLGDATADDALAQVAQAWGKLVPATK